MSTNFSVHEVGVAISVFTDAVRMHQLISVGSGIVIGENELITSDAVIAIRCLFKCLVASIFMKYGVNMFCLCLQVDIGHDGDAHDT